MVTFANLPIEVRGLIYEACFEDSLHSSSCFAVEAAMLARKLLPLVCKDFADLDQRFILNLYKDIAFEQTAMAIRNIAGARPEKDAENRDFKRHLVALFSRNNSISVDFSTMSEEQGKIFLKEFDAAVKSKSAKIQNLKITAAKALPDLRQLHGLRYLEISDSPKLTGLPSVDSLGSLKQLEITDCPGLVELPSLDALVSLEKLNISNCPSLTGLPLFDQLGKLKEFKISGCNGLSGLPPLNVLRALRSLVILACETLNSLPAINMLNALDCLMIDGCTKLNSLPSRVFLDSREANVCSALALLRIDA